MANLRTNNLSGQGGRNAYSGSVFFDGSSYLEIASSSDFAYGTGDFTWEAWVLLARGQATGYIFDHGNDGGTLQYESNKVRYYNSTTGNSGALYDDGGSIDYDGWHHIAVARSSGTTKLFVNGIQKASASDSHNYSAQVLTIGDYGANTGTNKWKGYFSNLRICKGHAVYTAAFTPPTSPLTVHYNSEGDETVLLCCQDFDDPTKDTAGRHTITGFGRYADSSVELVPNGGPTTDVTGWTAYNSSVAYDAGQIKITRSGGTGFSAYATITNAVIGQRYRASAQVRSPSSRCDLYVTTAVASGTLLQIFGTAGATVDLSGEFTATATTLYVFAAVDNDGDIGYYNRVSVKAADYGDALKVLPPYGVDAGNIFGGAISMNSSSWMYFPTGRTEERGRGRGVLFGGYNPSSGPAGVDEIYYLSIQSMGNAVRFSDLSTNSYSGSTTCASSTRALKAGGATGPGSANPNKTNNIEYVTIATTGNASDFGDMLAAISFNPGGGNQTRGIWMGGEAPGAPGSSAVDTIQYVTIATTGDATDFGDLRAGSSASATGASPTRMLAMGGGNPSSFFAYIDYVEIATTGNAQDFGDMSTNRNQNTGVSSNTRAIAMGGNTPSGLVNSMEFVTIATLGDATDFGDLSSGTEHTGSVNNSTRGVQVGGRFPAYVNTMEFITIATTGNSSDFGDIPKDSLAYIAGASDSHGGLS